MSNTIKSFTIINFQNVRVVEVDIHYTSGVFRSYRVRDELDIPETVKRARESGLFEIVRERNSNGIHARKYELK